MGTVDLKMIHSSSADEARGMCVWGAKHHPAWTIREFREVTLGLRSLRQRELFMKGGRRGLGSQAEADFRATQGACCGYSTIG